MKESTERTLADQHTLKRLSITVSSLPIVIFIPILLSGSAKGMNGIASSILMFTVLKMPVDLVRELQEK